MRNKVWYLVAAIVFFIAGFYEAYQQAFLYMGGLFVLMGLCLGVWLRGRNTWML